MKEHPQLAIRLALHLSAALLAAAEDINVERNVPVPICDGVVLCADVFRPAATGLHPSRIILPVIAVKKGEEP